MEEEGGGAEIRVLREWIYTKVRLLKQCSSTPSFPNPVTILFSYSVAVLNILLFKVYSKFSMAKWYIANGKSHLYTGPFVSSNSILHPFLSMNDLIFSCKCPNLFSWTSEVPLLYWFWPNSSSRKQCSGSVTFWYGSGSSNRTFD